MSPEDLCNADAMLFGWEEASDTASFLRDPLCGFCPLAPVPFGWLMTGVISPVGVPWTGSVPE